MPVGIDRTRTVNIAMENVFRLDCSCHRLFMRIDYQIQIKNKMSGGFTTLIKRASFGLLFAFAVSRLPQGWPRTIPWIATYWLLAVSRTCATVDATFSNQRRESVE